MNLRFIDIPKIENDTLLEDLAKSLLRADPSIQNVSVHGRPGQKQDGVDIYGRNIHDLTWIGIQCKVRSFNNSFSKTELLTEINQAKKFNPSLSKYYLFTTLNRDVNTQTYEREINNELAAENSFLFEIKFWEDIEDMLRDEKNETVYYRFYHNFFKDNLSLGHSIGKLVNLSLGIDNKYDTRFELIIGKIPKNNDNKGHQVDYYRGTYYIVNLHENKIEFFQKKNNSKQVSCYPSDIEYAFSSKFDNYRICKWLISIDDFDTLLYNDEHNHKFSLSPEEYESYLKED